MAIRTYVQGGCESEVRNDSPRPSQTSVESFLRLGSADSVEAFFDNVEDSRCRFLIRKPKDDLRDHRSCRESADVFAELGASARYIEPAERLKLAVGSEVNFRESLGKQVHRAAEALPRATCASSEHRLNSGLTREKTKNSRCFEVVERMENDRFGDERSHGVNLQTPAVACAEQHGSSRSGIVQHSFVFPIERVLEPRGE